MLTTWVLAGIWILLLILLVRRDSKSNDLW